MQQDPNMNMPYGSHMQHEGMDQDSRKNQMKDFCKRYHHHYIQIEGTDGNVYDGIIDGSDKDNMYVLVPSGEMDDDDNMNRQFYPYGGYGGYDYDYDYHRRFPRRFRRFRRHRFPFFFIRRLFFPFFY